MTAQETPTPTRTIVLHVGGLQWATSARGIEHTLTNRPGVFDVEANALSQTATVIFDPTLTSLDELQGWIRECGYHCAGESVPDTRVRPRRTAPQSHAPPKPRRSHCPTSASRHTTGDPSGSWAGPW